MKLDKFRVLFSKNLHGKLYLSEEEAIITSMNIYDYSQVNNIEFGIHIIKNKDEEIYNGSSLLYVGSRPIFPATM